MSSNPTSPGTLTASAARPTVIATPGAGTAGALLDGARRGDVRLRIGSRGRRLSVSRRSTREAHRPPLCARAAESDRQPRDGQIQRAPEPAWGCQLVHPRYSTGRPRGGRADRADSPSRDTAPSRILADGTRPGALPCAERLSPTWKAEAGLSSPSPFFVRFTSILRSTCRSSNDCQEARCASVA